MHRANSSIIFYDDYYKNVYTTLTDQEINIFYVLLENAAIEKSDMYSIDLETMPRGSEQIIKKLRTMIMAVIRIDGSTVKEIEDINLISRSKIRDGVLYYFIESDILEPYINHRNEFDHIFIKISSALKSKYSRFLYRILTEHRGTEFKVHYEVLMLLLNLNDPKYLGSRSYRVFERDILSKAVEDINAFTDLKVTYYKIRDRSNHAKVDKYVFESHTQINTLNTSKLSESEKLDIEISERINHKVSSQLNIAMQKSRITDKNAYVQRLIDKVDREDISAEIRLDKWLEYIKKEFKPNSNQPSILCIDPHGKKEFFSLTNDYALYDLINQKCIAVKPKRTMKKINEWLTHGAEISFKSIGKIYDDLLISYINLQPGLI